MNDMQIYAQVARKPRIGAAEIAENLNLTLATVSADLRVLVDAGDLVKSTHFNEDNGRQWQVYELSEEFKASRTYATLVGMPTAVPEPAAAPVPAAAAAPTQTVAPSPAVPPKPAASVSKVQLAINCITKLGAATDDQLRDAMGLPAKAYASTYLKSAVVSGKVRRDGDHWKLGSTTAIAPTVERRQANKGIEERANVKGLPSTMTEPLSQPTLVKSTAPAAPVPAQHRCAIWSDGTYELQTDGVRVAVLSHEQAVAFVSFIERIGAA